MSMGLSSKRVAHDASVAAIRDQQNRLGGIAQIDHIAVRIVHLIDWAGAAGARAAAARASTASAASVPGLHRAGAA